VTQEVRFAGARQLSFACSHRIVLAFLRGSLTNEPALLLDKLPRQSQVGNQPSGVGQEQYRTK